VVMFVIADFNDCVTVNFVSAFMSGFFL